MILPNLALTAAAVAAMGPVGLVLSQANIGIQCTTVTEIHKREELVECIGLEKIVPMNADSAHYKNVAPDIRNWVKNSTKNLTLENTALTNSVKVIKNNVCLNVHAAGVPVSLGMGHSEYKSESRRYGQGGMTVGIFDLEGMKKIEIINSFLKADEIVNGELEELKIISNQDREKGRANHFYIDTKGNMGIGKQKWERETTGKLSEISFNKGELKAEKTYLNGVINIGEEGRFETDEMVTKENEEVIREKGWGVNFNIGEVGKLFGEGTGIKFP